MAIKAWHSILYGQLLLYGGLLICVFIRPHGLVADDGVSYYGIFLSTILPYCLALLGSAYFSWRAASNLRHNPWLSQSLYAITALTIGIVLTPYSANSIFDWLHTSFGSLLFIIQLIMTGRLAFQGQRSYTCISLWLIELAGGIVSAFYVMPSKGYLIESQIVFQLACGSLLIYSLRRPKAAIA